MRYETVALILYIICAISLIVDLCLLKTETVTHPTAAVIFLVAIVLFMIGNYFRKIAKYWEDKK